MYEDWKNDRRRRMADETSEQTNKQKYSITSFSAGAYFCDLSPCNFCDFIFLRFHTMVIRFLFFSLH